MNHQAKGMEQLEKTLETARAKKTTVQDGIRQLGGLEKKESILFKNKKSLESAMLRKQELESRAQEAQRVS